MDDMPADEPEAEELPPHKREEFTQRLRALLATSSN